MRAGGVCDVNPLAGLILSMCSNDESLTVLEDSEVALTRVQRILVYREIRVQVHSAPVKQVTLPRIEQILFAVKEKQPSSSILQHYQTESSFNSRCYCFVIKNWVSFSSVFVNI